MDVCCVALQRDLRCLDPLCSYLRRMNPGDKSIALIGFMGAGKSAVGRELSRRIGWPRHDTDEMIRAQFGISIPDIFARLATRSPLRSVSLTIRDYQVTLKVKSSLPQVKTPSLYRWSFR